MIWQAKREIEIEIVMSDVPTAGEVFRGDDGTVSTVLPTNYGQDYEPSDEEIQEYAEYIGIDVEKEPDLMWIAKEGLRAPLPEGWRACQTDGNEVYYFDFKSGESLWDHPLDEHYKSKVQSERSKRGQAKQTASATATMMGSSTNTGPKPIAGRPNASSGSTKAISNSFFLKPAQVAGGSESSSPLGPPSNSSASASPGVPPTGHFGMAAGGGYTASVSAPRGPPDVSDILRLGTASPTGPPTSRTTGGPFNIKDAENVLRRRLEEQNEIQLRALRIDLEKRAGEERRRLEEQRLQLQQELDQAWEKERSGGGPGAAGNATQRRLEVAREIKQVEESWKTRLHEVSVRVMDLQKVVEEKQQALAAQCSQSPEALRKDLEARCAAELQQQRLAEKKKTEVAVAERKSEYAAALAECKARAKSDIESGMAKQHEATKKKISEHEELLQQKLAALKQSCEAKKAMQVSLEQQHATADATSALKLAEQRRSMEEEDQKAAAAALAAAEAIADADVQRVRESCSAATSKVRKACEEKEAAASAQPSREVSTTSFSKASSSAASPTTLTSGKGLSFSEQEGIAAEEAKLRLEMENASRIFAEETELMVNNKRNGRPLTAAPLQSEDSSASAEVLASLSRTAAQEQRQRDIENSRNAVTMKQLETKHEQAMRMIKDKAAQQSGNAATTVFAPRQDPSFKQMLDQQQKKWLQDHPATVVEMPKLDPIPQLATVVESEMPTAEPPSEAEQKEIIRSRVSQLRDTLQERYATELERLEEEKSGEVEKWGEDYRASALEAVRKRIKEAEQATAAMAASAGEAEKQRQLAAKAIAQAEETAALEKVDAEMQEATASYERRLAALQGEIGAIEAQVVALQQAAAVAASLPVAPPLPPPVAVSSEAVKENLPLPLPAVNPLLYISDEEAAAEEAALRSRWISILAALRAAINHQMGLYERALSEESLDAAGAALASVSGGLSSWSTPLMQLSQSTPGVTAATALSQPRGLVPSTAMPSLPPPAPALGSSLSAGSGGGLLSCYSTPVNRTRLSQEAEGSSAAGYRVPPLGVSQLASPHHISGGVAWAEQPSPHVLANTQHPNMGGIAVPPWSSASPARGLPATAMSGGGGVADSTLSWRSASPYLRLDGGVPELPNTDGPRGGAAMMATMEEAELQRRTASLQRRLSTLRLAFRERRRNLQLRQQRMEELREEWRTDMKAAKQRKDTAEIQQLRRVKDALEMAAKQLNEEVLAAKGIGHQLRKEESLYQAHVESIRGSSAAAPQNLVDLVMSVVRRTERLEEVLLHATAASHSSM